MFVHRIFFDTFTAFATVIVIDAAAVVVVIAVVVLPPKCGMFVNDLSLSSSSNIENHMLPPTHTFYLRPDFRLFRANET